jgi:hypothetical protein
MTISAFPPATPVLNVLATIHDKASNITMADIQRTARQAMVITLAVIAFIGGVLIALAKRSHQMLKGVIILLRIAADLLERLDDQIEQLILDNQPVATPDTTTTEAAPIPQHPLTQLAEDLMPNTTEELPSITRTRRKRSKRAMVEGFVSMPV